MSQRERDNSERIPEALVDQFFDRELDEGSRERLFTMLRDDLPRCAEVAKTQRLISMLREPVEAPDLTDRILGRMERRRAFLPGRLRAFVKAGRLAAAACVLIGILAVAMVGRYRPEALRLVSVPQPLSGVIESSRADATTGAKHLADAIVVLNGQGTERPNANPARRGVVVTGLTPGKTSVFTLPRKGLETALVVPGGAGTASRFVLKDGACIDLTTSRAVALGFGPPRALPGECVEGPEVYVLRVMEMVGLQGAGGGSDVARGSRR